MQFINLTKPEPALNIFDNNPEIVDSLENKRKSDEKKILPFVREPHHEKDDEDLGLPEHPIFSNYIKYLWKRKPQFKGSITK